MFVHLNSSVIVGISKVYPDSSGTRMVIVDEKSDAFIYNPVRKHVSLIVM